MRTKHSTINRSSNHGSARKNGSRNRGPVSKKLPKVLSLRKAKHPRGTPAVLIYGNVQSRSRGTRLIHNVVAARTHGRLRFKCSCESVLFNIRRGSSKQSCIHVQAVLRTMKTRKMRGAR